PLFLFCRARLRSHRAGRRLRAGLSAHGRSPGVWSAANAEQNSPHQYHRALIRSVCHPSELPESMTRLETLQQNLLAAFGPTASLKLALNELTLEVPADQWVEACTKLRDNPSLGFETCIDLCGVDYSAWGAPASMVKPETHPHRFAV